MTLLINHEQRLQLLGGIEPGTPTSAFEMSVGQQQKLGKVGIFRFCFVCPLSANTSECLDPPDIERHQSRMGTGVRMADTGLDDGNTSDGNAIVGPMSGPVCAKFEI